MLLTKKTQISVYTFNQFRQRSIQNVSLFVSDLKQKLQAVIINGMFSFLMIYQWFQLDSNQDFLVLMMQGHAKKVILAAGKSVIKKIVPPSPVGPTEDLISETYDSKTLEERHFLAQDREHKLEMLKLEDMQKNTKIREKEVNFKIVARISTGVATSIAYVDSKGIIDLGSIAEAVTSFF